MTRQLLIMGGIAATAGAAGLTLLLRPALVRSLFGMADSEPAAYALRIAGAMLFALSLFLGGFALAIQSAQ